MQARKVHTMDIASPFTAIGQAIAIAKDLQSIERGLDTAEFKAKTAELYSALADVKMALTDARQEIHEKDQEILRLRNKIDDLEKGDYCPLCNSGRLKVTAVKAHPQRLLNQSGVQERTLTCQNPECGHEEKRTHDPLGRLGAKSPAA